MIKEALEFLANLQAKQTPVIEFVLDQPYAVNSDGTLGDPVRQLAPHFVKPTFQVSSLSGLVTLFKEKVDSLPEKVCFQIVDPFNVQIVDLDADSYGRRHVYASASHTPDMGFTFGHFYQPEAFLLALRSGFLFTDNAAKIQQLCSTVTAGNSIGVADDGVSQTVKIEEGAVTKSAITLPSDGIPLIPNRTFREANPIESKFLLRMKGVKDNLPTIALFEIDPKWKLDTVESLRHYLVKHLPESAIIVA